MIRVYKKQELCKKIAILQSNYIPWKGYFDMISAVDEFILYDDMQYTRRDWRNRNKIKTPKGLQWLTVPVQVKGKYYQTIRETELDSQDWSKKHWGALLQNYKDTPYYKEILGILESVYLQEKHTHLSSLNRSMIEVICSYLNITTKIKSSTDYQLIDGKTERLVDLCVQSGATEYISGPAAKDYVEPNLFEDKAIKLSWFDYSGYNEYPQLWGKFEHSVTILDLLFNCGKETHKHMKYVNP